MDMNEIMYLDHLCLFVAIGFKDCCFCLSGFLGLLRPPSFNLAIMQQPVSYTNTTSKKQIFKSSIFSPDIRSNKCAAFYLISRI